MAEVIIGFVQWKKQVVKFCMKFDLNTGVKALAPCASLEGRIISNQYKVHLSNRLYSVMKHFYIDGTDLCQDNSSSLHIAWGYLTK